MTKAIIRWSGGPRRIVKHNGQESGGDRRTTQAPVAHRLSSIMSPLVLSTWSFGPVAAGAAMPVLRAGGSALDAAVAGATAVEDDPTVDSVGVGGLPDASGEVSLDACVMTAPNRCGSVAALRGHLGAAKLAKAVMERTIHVMLAGEGAAAFAKRQGFPDANTLTPGAQAAWEAWRDSGGTVNWAEREGFTPPMNGEERYRLASNPEPSHDTVCVLARDQRGELAGACTTSGLAFKVPGRVGDSPIIGHGLYVDPAAGAASATGNGELVMGVCGSFLAVEEMRRGKSPLDAIMIVLQRVREAYDLKPDHQVAMIAMRPDGAWASAALRPGFSHCIADDAGTRVEPAQRVLMPS